ncbi:MAG: hypothetical protein M0000_09955 [Actinomycetota bacterium]|nr:hypothetical protein [Actinomycetota bacterium]
MDANQYEYDVAFSFVVKDEPLATRLDELLRGRLKTFLYSERQKEIAGTDGELTFNEVFGKKARTVVVLYRDGWGRTPWSRVEETAIRNRGHDHGYDFALFIPLDESPACPEWLPKNRLWIGLRRWGLEGAAGVIEARVQEMGGEPHEESVIERAARLDQSLKFEAHRKQFLNSTAGVRAAADKFGALRTEIEQVLGAITESTSSIPMSLKSGGRQVVIVGFGLGLTVEWHPQASNTLDGAKLRVELWGGQPPMPGVIQIDTPPMLRKMEFDFDLLSSDDSSIWRGSDTRVYTNKQLAEFLLDYFMDQGVKAHKKPRRRD